MPVLRHVRREYLTFVTYSVVRYSAPRDTLHAYQLDANYRYVFPRHLLLFGSRFTFESPLSERTRERVERSAKTRDREKMVDGERKVFLAHRLATIEPTVFATREPMDHPR